MCRNVFHEEPCNCDGSRPDYCGESDEQKFKKNYKGILTKEAAWQSYQEELRRKTEKSGTYRPNRYRY